mgnify:CR=1 FL=1
MKKYENGIVVGRISGQDYVSKDNGDSTYTIVCAIGDVPEIKRNHDRLKHENAELRDASLGLIDSLHLMTNVMFITHRERDDFLKAKQNLIKLLKKLAGDL